MGRFPGGPGLAGGEGGDGKGRPHKRQGPQQLYAAHPYSPEPKINSEVQELRIYEAVPGRLPDLHARFENHTTGFFRQYGMDVIGYWTDDVGTSNRLIYMLGYPSLADREKSWKAFSADPQLAEGGGRVPQERHPDGEDPQQNPSAYPLLAQVAGGWALWSVASD